MFELIRVECSCVRGCEFATIEVHVAAQCCVSHTSVPLMRPVLDDDPVDDDDGDDVVALEPALKSLASLERCCCALSDATLAALFNLRLLLVPLLVCCGDERRAMFAFIEFFPTMSLPPTTSAASSPGNTSYCH